MIGNSPPCGSTFTTFRRDGRVQSRRQSRSRGCVSLTRTYASQCPVALMTSKWARATRVEGRVTPGGELFNGGVQPVRCSVRERVCDPAFPGIHHIGGGDVQEPAKQDRDN